MVPQKKERSFILSIKQIGARRIAIALIVAIVGGWAAIALTLSGLTRSKNPLVALTAVSGESNALANRADQLLLASPTNPSPAITQLARAALGHQAINAKAVRQLGYAADAKGDRKRALALVTMAERLSRREAGAQLWLIEYYAQANNTSKTLSHYDILLKTEPDTQTLLYTRLSNAIADEPNRAALLPYVRQDRPWASGFIWHAINNDKDLTNVVNLITEAKVLPKNDKTKRAQEVALIGRLVAEKRFGDAKRIYDLIPGARSTRLTNPSFDDSDRRTRFGAMGWQIPDSPDAGGGFLSEDGQNAPALSIFTNSATTQIVASRLLYLNPSSYRFLAKISQLQTGDGGYVRFQMRCPTRSDSSPVWIFDVDPKRTFARIDIPSDCPVQFLDIVGSGGKGQLGMEAVIGSITITRSIQ
jgi:tetratricopeptide (TPR) repeat protein